MKLFRHLIIASALVMSAGIAPMLTSCNDDDKNLPAYFHVDNREFTIEYDGLTDKGIEPSFTLNATGDWKVSQKDQWIHLSREAGTRGSHNIFVTADENTTGESRRGFVEITLNGTDKVELLAITQNKKVGTLTVSPALIDITTLGEVADGGDAQIVIETNSDWTLELEAGCDWLSLTKKSGQSGKNYVPFTVTANTTGTSREAKVTVNAAGLTRYATVRQDGEAFKVDADGAPVTKLAFEAADMLTATVNVSCIEAWSVTEKPEWITISPASGQAGTTEVTVTAEANAGAPREGFITITTEHGFVLNAPVAQMSNQAVPDSKEVGFVYYSDDFSWVKGGSDQVSNINGGAPNDARNLYTWDFKSNGFDDILALFNQRYTDRDPNEKVIYAMDGYLKFNRGGHQTAIEIKNELPIATGCYADVEVSFMAAKNGTDPITVTVMIEGDGEIENGVSPTQSRELAPVNNSDKTIPWTWTPLSVTIRGATANTKITIGATAFILNGFQSVATYPDNGKTTYFRWFMDDLKVTRIETK